MTLIPNPIAARISLVRRLKDLSQTQLAELSGLPQSQVSRLESGQTADPSLSMIAAIARALDLSIDKLISASGDEFIASLDELHLDKDEFQIAFGTQASTGKPQLLQRLASRHFAPHMLIQGNTGSGKSFAAKLELIRSFQAGASIAVIDPSGEYNRIANQINSKIIDFMDPKVCINVFDFTASKSVDLAAKIKAVSEWIETLVYSYEQTNKKPLQEGSNRFKAISELVTRVYKSKGLDETTSQDELLKALPSDMPTLSDFYRIASSVIHIKSNSSMFSMMQALSECCAEKTVEEIRISYVQEHIKQELPVDSGLYIASKTSKYATLLDGFSTENNSAESRAVFFDISNVSPTYLTVFMNLAIKQAEAWWANRATKRFLLVDEMQLMENSPTAFAAMIRMMRNKDLVFTLCTQGSYAEPDQFSKAAESLRRELLSNCSHKLLLKQHPRNLGPTEQIDLAISPDVANSLSSIAFGEGYLMTPEKNHWINLRSAATPEEYQMLTTSMRIIDEIHKAPKEVLDSLMLAEPHPLEEILTIAKENQSKSVTIRTGKAVQMLIQDEEQTKTMSIKTERFILSKDIDGLIQALLNSEERKSLAITGHFEKQIKIAGRNINMSVLQIEEQTQIILAFTD